MPSGKDKQPKSKKNRQQTIEEANLINIEETVYNATQYESLKNKIRIQLIVFLS